MTTEQLSESLEAIPERSQIDYVLRTTKQHQTLMFQLADQKASILTGISMVMMSLSFGQIQANGFSISLAVFGVANMISAILALTAVIPALPRKVGGDGGNNFNPLFFGHANSISEDEFVEKISEKLITPAQVNDLIIRDLHQLGRVAGRKFARVRIAYQVLLVGLISGAIALGAELILKN